LRQHKLSLPSQCLTASAEDAGTRDNPYAQEIHFCQTKDGVQLAYSRMGQGLPLVKTGNWMTRLEFDFESPIWRHLYGELSRNHTFIRYDARGNGLSDREVPEVSFEDFVDDLETVVDAAGIDRFALLGISHGLRADRRHGGVLQHDVGNSLPTKSSLSSSSAHRRRLPAE
jgi:hypothetical protein